MEEILSKTVAYLSLGTLLLLILFWKKKWVKFKICTLLGGISAILWGYQHFFYLNELNRADKGFWVSGIAHKSFGVILALVGLFFIILGIIFNLEKFQTDPQNSEENNNQ
jgi:hypothetical protein